MMTRQNKTTWTRKLLSRLPLISRYATSKVKAPLSRIISRDGKVQISMNQMSFGKHRRYWKNPLTTLLHFQWRWIILIFSLGFIFTWTFFAVVYYIISASYGDVDIDSDEDYGCINNVDSFTTAFLFSLETQHTIGYGFRHQRSDCAVAAIIVFLQFITGVAVQCLTAGLVVTKLQMGKRNKNALQFSKSACIGKCDNEVCLMIRIGNSGNTELVGGKGFGVLIERHKTESHEEILTETYLDFTTENGSDFLNLLWPAVIHSEILANPRKFLAKIQSPTSELIITIEGVLKSTGQTLQMRTSYLCHEIEIGKQFVDISPKLGVNVGKGFYHKVDYADFHISQDDANWDKSLWSGKSAN